MQQSMALGELQGEGAVAKTSSNPLGAVVDSCNGHRIREHGRCINHQATQLTDNTRMLSSSDETVTSQRHLHNAQSVLFVVHTWSPDSARLRHHGWWWVARRFPCFPQSQRTPDLPIPKVQRRSCQSKPTHHIGPHLSALPRVRPVNSVGPRGKQIPGANAGVGGITEADRLTPNPSLGTILSCVHKTTCRTPAGFFLSPGNTCQLRSKFCEGWDVVWSENKGKNQRGVSAKVLLPSGQKADHLRRQRARTVLHQRQQSVSFPSSDYFSHRHRVGPPRCRIACVGPSQL